MLTTFFVLMPFLILLISGIITLAIHTNIELNRRIGLFGLIASLFTNSLLIHFIDEPVKYNALYVDTSSLWLTEIFILVILIIYLSINQNLKDSHSKEIISALYLIIGSSFIGIFLSKNLLVITVFYMIISLGLNMMFYLGPYKKKLTTLKKFTSVQIISFLVLILTDIIVDMTFNTLEINELITPIQDSSFLIQFLFFFGYLIGFGAACGIFPFLSTSLKNYFNESNIINFRLYSNVFIPLSGILTVRILSDCVKANLIFANIAFFVGFLGIIIMGVLTLFELFGKFHQKTKLLSKVVGYLSIMEFNVYLLLLSLYGLSFAPNPDDVLNATILFAIITLFAKSLLIDAVSPILDIMDDWDLKNMGGFIRKYPKFSIFLIAIPILYTLPGLLGYNFYIEIFPSVSTKSLEYPVQTAQIWSILVMIVLFELILLIVVATLLSEIFLGKSKSTELEVIPKPSKIHNISPILYLIVYFMLTILFYLGILTIELV
jgi:formate hydrogenlyase subunit 3/multisubunit Na+/H+ antiporter MnhD subunit